MDLNQAIDALASFATPEEVRHEATVVIRQSFKDVHEQLVTLQQKSRAVERVIYLLVQTHPNEELREEMHDLYTRISSGLASPEE